MSSVSLLCRGWGSSVIALTVAQLWIVRGDPCTLTLIVIWGFRPSATSPRSQFTLASEPVQDPRVELTERKRTLSGRLSLTVTPVAREGPRFSTFRV